MPGLAPEPGRPRATSTCCSRARQRPSSTGSGRRPSCTSPGRRAAPRATAATRTTSGGSTPRCELVGGLRRPRCAGSWLTGTVVDTVAAAAADALLRGQGAAPARARRARWTRRERAPGCGRSTSCDPQRRPPGARRATRWPPATPADRWTLRTPDSRHDFVHARRRRHCGGRDAAARPAGRGADRLRQTAPGQRAGQRPRRRLGRRAARRAPRLPSTTMRPTSTACGTIGWSPAHTKEMFHGE